MEKKIRTLRTKLTRARLSYQRLAKATEIVPEVFYDDSSELVFTDEEYNPKFIRRIEGKERVNEQ